MGSIRRIWWMLRNRNIVIWVFMHTIACDRCSPGSYCQPHERLVSKMIREADGK